MGDIERKYDCPSCWGTGSLESSDSTDESWWDCSTCEGTGKLADRRRPDPQLRGAVEDLLTFAQAVLDLPCAFGSEGDPLAAQQRRAADLINTYRGQ